MEIPVINISPLINGECDETHEVMTKLKLGCKDVSCFYITGHGIDQSLMESVMNYGRDFFSLSMENKNAISLEKSAAFRGYIRQGFEKTANKVDVKEGIYFGPEVSPNNPAERAKTCLMGPNQFPDEIDLPGFSQILMEYSNKMTVLGYALMKALVRGLQFNEEFIQEKFNPAYPLLALWHYPPVPAESEAWGVGPHTDYGALTMLMQDDVGGLQVETKDGDWIDVPPIPGTFVVNFGDVVEGWTQGELRATMHRVKNSTSKHRISAPFFFQPGLDCVIESLKDVKLAEVRSIHGLDVPFSFGEYLLSKLKKSYSVN